MLFFWVLKGYIVWGSRRTYQAVKEALSCFLPIGPLPVSPGRPVSLWQQLLAACRDWGWAAQLQTSVGSGPPSSLFLFCTHIHWSPQSVQHKGLHSSPSYSLLVKRSSEAPKLLCLLSLSFYISHHPLRYYLPSQNFSVPIFLSVQWMFFHSSPWESNNH